MTNIFFAFVLISAIFTIMVLPLAYINKLYEDLKSTNSDLYKFKNISQLEQNVKNMSLYAEKKKALIKKLESQRLDAVTILEDLSLNIPDRASIASLKYQKNTLEIDGEAFTEADIAVFMLNLRSIDYVEDVKILSVESTDKGLLKYILQVKLKVVS